MSNQIADELATFRSVLLSWGWVQTNGNTLKLYNDHADVLCEVRTAYVYGEATVEVSCSTEPLRDYYRGAELLTWAKTEAVPLVKSFFEEELDTEVECA